MPTKSGQRRWPISSQKSINLSFQQKKKTANQFGWPANFFGWLIIFVSSFFNDEKIYMYRAVPHPYALTSPAHSLNTSAGKVTLV